MCLKALGKSGTSGEKVHREFERKRAKAAADQQRNVAPVPFKKRNSLWSAACKWSKCNRDDASRQKGDFPRLGSLTIFRRISVATPNVTPCVSTSSSLAKRNCRIMLAGSQLAAGSRMINMHRTLSTLRQKGVSQDAAGEGFVQIMICGRKEPCGGWHNIGREKAVSKRP
jgi:hypothetical protein